MPNKQKRVLPLVANVYDTLELVAEMAGGVGRDHFWTGQALDPDRSCPVCIHGCAAFGEGGSVNEPYSTSGVIASALLRAGIRPPDNDDAVAAIQKRLGLPAYARVTFADWAQELNVVRGPHPEPAPNATWPKRRRLRSCRDDAASTSPEASI